MRAHQLQQIFESKRNVQVPTKSGNFDPFNKFFEFHKDILPSSEKFYFKPESVFQVEAKPEDAILPSNTCYFESTMTLGGKDLYWAVIARTVSDYPPVSTTSEPPVENFHFTVPDIKPLWRAHLFVRYGKEPYWTMFAPQAIVGINSEEEPKIVYEYSQVRGSDLLPNTTEFEIQKDAMHEALNTIVYFLHLMRAENSKLTTVHQMTGKGAQKFKKLGRVPLFSYKTLEVI